MMTAVVAVVSSLACALPSLSQAQRLAPAEFQPCAERAHQFEDGVGGLQWYWDVDDVRPCLDNIKISLHAMALTLENLFFGVSTIYSYTTIATDAASSVQQNRCGLGVHGLNVNLYKELALIWEELVEPAARDAGLQRAANMTADDILDALDRPSQVAALDFHSRLNALFSSLQDGHTLYVVPSHVTQTLPLEFELEASGPGNAGRPRVLARPAGPNNSVQGFREVVSINAGDPLDFLQAIADRRGRQRDEGQRLNELILRFSQVREGLQLFIAFDSDLVPSRQSAVHVGFADGAELQTKWRVQVDPYATVDALRSENPLLARLQAMEAEKLLLWERWMGECVSIPGCDPDLARWLVPQGPEQPQAVRAYKHLFGDWLPEEALSRLAKRGALKARARLDQAAPHPVPGLSAPASASARAGRPASREPTAKRAEEDEPGTLIAPQLRGARGLAAPRGGGARWVGAGVGAGVGEAIRSCLANSSGPGRDTARVLYESDSIVVMAVGDMVVIKVPSFGGGLMGPIMEGFKTAVAYARRQGLKRVLFDLISNTGGAVAATDLLQSLALKIYDAAELCDDYNQKINAYWREWILSFGADLDVAITRFIERIGHNVSKIPLRVGKKLARWQLRRLSIILRTSRDLDLESCDASFNLSRVDRWIRQVDRARSKGDLLMFMGRVMRRREFIPGCLYTVNESEAQQGRLGWFPFQSDWLFNRTTLAPFPQLSGYLTPVTQEWGDGRAAGQQYAQRGVIFVCPSHVASIANLRRLAGQGLPDLREYRDHPFTDVAVVTDGLAASAGSAFSSRLMASGFATIFTYGGNGKAMDSAAFAGGNVEEYYSWWRRAAVAAELGMWLVPGSSWERLSKSLNLTSTTGGVESVIYPRPMPARDAIARFNFNMAYVREFDVKDDSTQLPREWYRLPAHKHFDVWPKRLDSPCANPKGLLDMYVRIQGEDWWHARTNPQFLDAGWAGVCVPDESHKECCVTRQAPDEL